MEFFGNWKVSWRGRGLLGFFLWESVIEKTARQLLGVVGG